MAGEVTYRLARHDEWPRLAEFVTRSLPPEQQRLPAPEVASAAIAERDGQIVGVLFAQLAMHVDSFAVAPEARGTGISYGRLTDVLDALLGASLGPGVVYMALHEDPTRRERMEQLGFTPQPWVIYTRETT